MLFCGPNYYGVVYKCYLRRFGSLEVLHVDITINMYVGAQLKDGSPVMTWIAG